LHVATPGFYDTLYASSASGEKRDKYSWFTKAFGMDQAMFATPDHEVHKRRRAALNPFFSMQSVRRLQPVIQERVDVLLMRIEGFQRSKEVLMASHMFAAFTNGMHPALDEPLNACSSDNVFIYLQFIQRCCNAIFFCQIRSSTW
jgi:hypothetical protein